MTATDSVGVPYILTINTGSSSLKAALYESSDTLRARVSMSLERIGLAGAHMSITGDAGRSIVSKDLTLKDNAAALQAVLEWLASEGYTSWVTCVGHRIVHGGPLYDAPVRITDAVIGDLKTLVSIDPDHLPQALSAIEEVRRRLPDVTQVACFDTAFHRRMPKVATMVPLPKEYRDAGIVRYGFHGLSYESIMNQLQLLDAGSATGKIVVAHLGNGASMCAIRDGASVDTTMGFTPAGGLTMSTRLGDVDPGILTYLMQAHDLQPEELSALINKSAGLLGLSGSSSDMEDLLHRAESDGAAFDAVAVFCYVAKKFLGALTAALGGVDTLIFTGGIGEHASAVRHRVCDGLTYMGIELDSNRNLSHNPVISTAGSRVTVRVMRTDEDLMIARHSHRIVCGEGFSAHTIAT